MPNIKPLTFPIIGIAEKLNILILNFQTDATTCTTYYELTTLEGKKLAEGNYTLTPEEYDAWGDDNSYIDNIVASQIGVEIIP